MKRALGPAGHIISGTQAYISLSEGERPGRVLVEVGVSSAAAAAGIGAATASLMIGGAVGLPLAIGLTVFAVFYADDFGQFAGGVYDDVVPPTPRQLLLEHGETADYSEDGKVSW